MASLSNDAISATDALRAIWAGPVPAMDDRFVPLTPDMIHRSQRSPMRTALLGAGIAIVALVGVMGAVLTA